MGWELRKGRRYLYRNSRVNGQPRKEYIVAEGEFGSLMAHKLHEGQECAEEVRDALRNRGQAFRNEIDAQLAATATENGRLLTVVEGTLVALGFHNHHRGEWRMARNNVSVR
jgi:hypothetical protein